MKVNYNLSSLWTTGESVGYLTAQTRGDISSLAYHLTADGVQSCEYASWLRESHHERDLTKET